MDLETETEEFRAEMAELAEEIQDRFTQAIERLKQKSVRVYDEEIASRIGRYMYWVQEGKTAKERAERALCFHTTILDETEPLADVGLMLTSDFIVRYFSEEMEVSPDRLLQIYSPNILIANVWMTFLKVSESKGEAESQTAEETTKSIEDGLEGSLEALRRTWLTLLAIHNEMLGDTDKYIR